MKVSYFVLLFFFFSRLGQKITNSIEWLFELLQYLVAAFKNDDSENNANLFCQKTHLLQYGGVTNFWPIRSRVAV